MKIASLMVLAVACAALPAGAQESPYSTRGVGLGLSYNQVKVGGGSPVFNGGGLAATVSYGVNDRLSLFARTEYGYRAAHLDAGLRYSFRPADARLRPYLELGASRVGAREYLRSSTLDPEGFYRSDVAQSSGFAATAGAGVEYFFNRKLALDAGVLYSRGRLHYTEVNGQPQDGSRGYEASRFNLGFRWRP